MTTTGRVFAFAAISALAAFAAISALAVTASQAQEQSGPKAEGAEQSSKAARPFPPLYCDFETMNACASDGTCKAGKDVAGMALPLKVTVDFENRVVTALEESGYPRADRFDGLAESAGQFIVHGIDGAFGWQLLIDKNSEHASMTFATADTMISGFGTCSAK